MIERIEDHMALTCNCGSVNWNLIKSGKIECASCGNVIDQGWGDIKFHDVSVNGNSRKQPEPMKAKIDVWNVVLNNLAVNELIDICGSDQYKINVMLSDCGNIVGLKPVLHEGAPVTQPRRSVSCGGFRDKLGRGLAFRPDFKLTRYKDMLIFNIKEDSL